jgi:hypothetical protein
MIYRVLAIDKMLVEKTKNYLEKEVLELNDEHWEIFDVNDMCL